MKTRRHGHGSALSVALLLGAALPSGGREPAASPVEFVDGQGVRCGISRDGGAIASLRSGRDGRSVSWLDGPVRVEVANELSGVRAAPVVRSLRRTREGLTLRAGLPGLGLDVDESWTRTPSGLAWDLVFSGKGKRAGHEVAIDLPVLKASRQVFTPGERGVMSVAFHPTFKPVAYGTNAWDSGRCYVLPLVSVLDTDSDMALTVALPPNACIPHFQVEWDDARILRLRLAHRGMGAGIPSALRLLLYAHAADHRSAIKAYSDEFPAYFKPVLPRGEHEGAFYYHHIHDHPDFAEMSRQGVRYVWTSFWFAYLGEYLPEETTWYPYTYSRWWRLGQMMSDARINAFISEMRAHGIGTLAYFNVTEFGGAGGKDGGSDEADRRLRGELAEALVRGPDGQAIRTWEGAMVVNPGRRYPLFGHLEAQLRRHLDRLPHLEGFSVDRLDWASRYDHGHADGLTMVGDQDVANLAVPVADCVQEICRLAHARGKRVHANQFYRIEVLRDVDAYTHENDYLRGLGYLSPFRPVAAWHHRKPYRGDLLEFEAHLKSRLRFAIFPHMIPREFPVSQQAPDPEAADLLELYAPLFALLRGKEQVLLPHCVACSGANDVNLFRVGPARYVAPVTSRVRFLSRGGGPAEPVTITFAPPDAHTLRWAQVYSADHEPRSAALSQAEGKATVVLPEHGTSSVVLVGTGGEPPLDVSRAAPPKPQARRPRPGAPAGVGHPERPSVSGLEEIILEVNGRHVDAQGRAVLVVGDRELGEARNGLNRFPLAVDAGALPSRPPVIGILTGDEGTWFVVTRARLLARVAGGKMYRVARWVPVTGPVSSYSPGDLRLALSWCGPEEVVSCFERREVGRGGGWKGRFGSRAAWIPLVVDRPEQNGYRLAILAGEPYTWAARVRRDDRVLEPPAGPAADGRTSTCWFSKDEISLTVTPPGAGRYRLTLYLLDYDRNGRTLEVEIRDAAAAVDTPVDMDIDMDTDVRVVPRAETDAGVYLSWTFSGSATVAVRRLEGYNAVISGVFVDDAEE